MKEKIRELEKVSKVRVSMIRDGIDSHWMMSKDLEAWVDDLLHKVGLMIEALNNNTAQLEFFTQVVDDQQGVIGGMKKKLKSICAAFQDSMSEHITLSAWISSA